MIKSSFRRRLVLSFVGLAVIPLLAAGTIVGWQTYQQSIEESRARQQELAQRVRVQVESIFHRIENILHISLNSSVFEQLDSAGRKKVLGDILAQRYLFKDAAYINHDGTVAVRLSNTHIVNERQPLSVQVQQVFQETVAGKETYYGEVYFDKVDGEPLVTIGVPVFHRKSGNVLGVVSMDLRFKAIWDLVARIHIDKGEAVYIVDTRGRVIAHPNPAVILRESNITINTDEFTSGLAQQDVVMAVAHFEAGNREFIVVVERSVQVVFDRAVNQLWNLLLVAAVSIAVALFLFLLISRHLLRPVSAISEAAKDIREGNWQRKVELEQEDEFGEMAAAFNSMTRRLTDTLARLENENSQRAHAEEKLLRAKERLETITQFESDWIYWRNEKKNLFYYISPTCETFTGYSMDEFQQDPGLLDSIMHPDDRTHWDSHSHKLDSENNLIPEEFILASLLSGKTEKSMACVAPTRKLPSASKCRS